MEEPVRTLRILLSVAAIIVVGLVEQPTAAVNRVRFQTHDIRLMLDVPNHRASFTDSGRAVVTIGWNLFYLNQSATVEKLSLAGEPIEFYAVTLADSATLPPELLPYLRENEADLPARLVLFQTTRIGGHPFSISYSGEFFEDVSKMRFSRERVGGEVAGTIGDQGAYLSPGAYYYPGGDEELVSFKLTADIPEAWESVSDGNRLSSELRGGRKVQSWENPFKSDGCMFMAAPYVTRSTLMDSVEVWCYFFEADTGLFDSYLSATAEYIRMYSDLIGPYPFKRFTVAENFFSTGYGMPAWTLLGQRVLQLPFIIGTSLGHEVLHNWWGNSVYVDYDRGNWCEGLTVYGADYRYKLLESEAAAREYRKDILKQYLAYVDEGNDFPLREFTSRSSPDTRSIGYGKAMMVFHMIEEEIGTEPFFDAWKLVYQRYIGKKIGWEEWIGAFEETSGKDLSYIIPQWIDRAGAPMITLDTAFVSQSNGQDCQVSYLVSQDGLPLYRLQIQDEFTIDGKPARSEAWLVDATDSFVFESSPCPTDFAIDPDYDLFRRLHPEEVEPIVSAVLGAMNQRFLCEADDATVARQFAVFASSFTEDTAGVAGYDLLQRPERDYTPIMLNPPELPQYLDGRVTLAVDAVTIEGTSFPRAGHTFVFAAQNSDGFEKLLVLYTSDFESLPRLGQLIPHYGKYSYLVFEGARNVAKGQWEVTDSPLRVTLP